MRSTAVALLVLAATILAGTPAAAQVPCPTSATFPIAVPAIPGVTPEVAVGSIVTQESGTLPKCKGTFTVWIVTVTPTGPVPIAIATGKFRASHGPEQTTAKFSGDLLAAEVEFKGRLTFAGTVASGTGTVVTTFELEEEDDEEVTVSLAFGCLGGFCGPTSPPTVSSAEDDDD